MVRIMGVRGLARLEIGEFRGHRLAHHHAARRPHARHAGRIDRRLMPHIGRTAVGGGQVMGFDDILDPHGQPKQRLARVGVLRATSIQNPCRRPRAISIQMAPGPHGIFPPGNAVQTGRQQIGSRQRPPPHRGPGLGSG